MTMVIHNARIMTMGEPGQRLENHALYIKDDKIVKIGPEDYFEAKYKKADRMDAKGQLILPGNICAHTHFYGAFARGMAVPGRPPKDFPEILHKLW